ITRPLAQEPSPRPAMNMETTIDTSALVTPNRAIDRRSHTISYRMPQNPDTKKKTKYQAIRRNLGSARVRCQTLAERLMTSQPAERRNCKLPGDNNLGNLRYLGAGRISRRLRSARPLRSSS